MNNYPELKELLTNFKSHKIYYTLLEKVSHIY